MINRGCLLHRGNSFNLFFALPRASSSSSFCIRASESRTCAFAPDILPTLLHVWFVVVQCGLIFTILLRDACPVLTACVTLLPLLGVCSGQCWLKLKILAQVLQISLKIQLDEIQTMCAVLQRSMCLCLTNEKQRRFEQTHG